MTPYINMIILFYFAFAIAVIGAIIMLNSDFRKILKQNGIDPRIAPVPLTVSSAIFLSLTPIVNMLVAYTFLISYDEFLDETIKLYNELIGENDNE
jgi:hypothetical protein